MSLEPTAQDAGHSPLDEGWNPELIEDLHDLVHRVGISDERFPPRLDGLIREHGDGVFTELIHLLSHLRFPPAEARMHWDAVLRHRETMAERLGMSVDLLVAMVSYFTEVNRQLEHPKIIEMRLFQRTQASAYRDELTGLYNYRLFREYLAQEMRRSQRHRTPLSLVMIDVDRFKRYNDLLGHDAGNRALSSIGELISGVMRKSDVPARYGGEEFALILPATSKLGAQAAAEKVRLAVEAHDFSPDLTISLGVATYPADGEEASDLVRAADRALYGAKSTGRNRVCLYGESRRSFERVETRLDGSCRTLGAETVPLTTLDLSEAGVRFRAPQPVEVGSFLEVRLQLSRTIVTAGRAVHCEPDSDPGWIVAAELFYVSPADRSLLMQHVHERQGAAVRDG